MRVRIRSGIGLGIRLGLACITLYVVAMFTPRVAISRKLGVRTACYWLSAWQQAGAVHHGTGTTAIVTVRRFVNKSLLFTCKWVG